MTEVSQSWAEFPESGTLYEPYHRDASERSFLEGPVLKCYYPDCSNGATQLCNQCGELYCAEHSALRAGTKSTVIICECSLCAGKVRKPINWFMVMSVLTITGSVGVLLAWYAYTLVSRIGLP